ncbi:unnamed protein product [Cylicocyclus nassatus]|uniref:Uncharacterized protein n=1 Tax=Cylicocyclus nassatus TaxID=53992 RepID=A0AA36GVQ4_CYLNA|nr:unnamed protein product [Cylicocyclus nassatus]
MSNVVLLEIRWKCSKVRERRCATHLCTCNQGRKAQSEELPLPRFRVEELSTYENDEPLCTMEEYSPHMFPEQEVEGVSRRGPNPDNNRVLDRNAMTWGRMSVYTCEGR